MQGQPAEYWTEYRRQFEENQKKQIQQKFELVTPSGVN